MSKSKTNGCEVKSTNISIKRETVNVKGKDILIFTTENGSNVQFMEDYLISDGLGNKFTEIGRRFCVYNKLPDEAIAAGPDATLWIAKDWTPHL